MVPSARVGHIGMYRDEETLEPHLYFCKMPKDVAEPRRADRGSHAGHRRQRRRWPSPKMKKLRLQAHQADGPGGSAQRASHIIQELSSRRGHLRRCAGRAPQRERLHRPRSGRRRRPHLRHQVNTRKKQTPHGVCFFARKDRPQAVFSLSAYSADSAGFFTGTSSPMTT